MSAGLEVPEDERLTIAEVGTHTDNARDHGTSVSSAGEAFWRAGVGWAHAPEAGFPSARWRTRTAWTRSEA